MIGLAALALAAATAGPLERCDPPPGWNAVERRQTRYIIFGETHGTREGPGFVGDVACALAFRGERLLVAVEEQASDDAALQAAWALPDDRFAGALRALPWWSGDDGRGSEAMVALLVRLHRLRAGGRQVDVVAFNGARNSDQAARFATLPSQGPHEAEQAENIRTADAGRYDHVLVLTGDTHAHKARIAEHSDFEPMAMRLAPAASVTSLAMRAAGGSTWNCELRPGFTFVPGKPLPKGAITCGAHPARASATLAGPPAVGLGDAAGAEADPGYDGFFWLGPVTASPPAVPAKAPRR